MKKKETLEKLIAYCEKQIAETPELLNTYIKQVKADFEEELEMLDK